MPFVQLSSGESVILEIVSEKPEVRFQHWFQGTPLDCAGEGCPFCQQSWRKTTRFQLEVKHAGEDLTWGFGKRVFTMLAFLGSDRKDYKGMFVELSRVGMGRDTQWLVKSAEPTTPSSQTELEQLKAKLAKLEGKKAEKKEEIEF